MHTFMYPEALHVCMEEANLHNCTEFDQLNTCIECGAPKNPHPEARFSGGVGARLQPLSDDDYVRARRQLERRADE